MGWGGDGWDGVVMDGGGGGTLGIEYNLYMSKSCLSCLSHLNSIG